MRVNPLRIDSSQFLQSTQSLANGFHFSGRLKTVVQQHKGKIVKLIKLTSLALAVAGLSATLVHAQDGNLSTLQRMGNTSTNMVIPTVAQEGKNADAIRANLKKVKLPDGFKIDLYAVVPDARYMAVAPSTNMLFVGTRKTTVWAVTNRNNGDAATEVKAFAPSIKFSNPNGVCFTKDGFLIVAESNRLLHFPAAEYFYEGPDVAVGVIVPEGKLIPVEEQSFNHTGRVCKVASDGKIFVSPVEQAIRIRTGETGDTAL